MQNIAKKAMSAAAKRMGVPIDGSLDELLRWVNETFDLGAAVTEVSLSPDAARDGILDLAASADVAVKLGKGQLFKLRATPEGKPPVTAFIVLGA